ncbi:MAG: putative zinc-binding metallopeptidase [Gammaproteobacteria bacterium]
MSDAALLDMRICDLNLKIPGSELESCIEQLHKELAQRAIRFRPHFWLSTEWFSPDGVPGVAIPFYLAHPRLKKLEQAYMLDVEGGNRKWCMKLLRHETGHALANAYRIHRRRGWRDHFGSPTQPYPETYLPKPYSKRFVIHLDGWYAQSHPHEDWAETFAVWLKPQSDWRQRYRGWSALKKLNYVDALMDEIHEQPAAVRKRAHVESVNSLRMTLGEYYAQKQATYTIETPEYYDRHLRRLFSGKAEYSEHESAALYLQRLRPEISEIIAHWSYEYRYRIDQIVRVLIQRCERLDLRVIKSDQRLKLETVSCITMLVMDSLHNGGFHVAL